MSSQRPTTHYDVLSLPHSSQNLTSEALKEAYRKSLLQYHPDKSNPNRASGGPAFSVDEITTAYTVLSTPRLRRKYDQELRVAEGGERGGGGGKVSQTVDLDELEYADGIWWKGCRCGEVRGFVVTEEDLDAGEGDGEVLVGCSGCSLWVRVVYEAVFDEGEGEGMGGGRRD